MTKALAGLRVIDTPMFSQDRSPVTRWRSSAQKSSRSKTRPIRIRPVSGIRPGVEQRRHGNRLHVPGLQQKAVALNLKVEGGREALKRLIETADVFVENYRPGAFESSDLAMRTCGRSIRASSIVPSPHLDPWAPAPSRRVMIPYCRPFPA